MESHEDSEDVSVSESRADVLVWLRGVFTRSPLGFPRSPHTVPAIPAVFLSWQVNWRENFFFETAEHPNYFKDASRAISDP